MQLIRLQYFEYACRILDFLLHSVQLTATLLLMSTRFRQNSDRRNHSILSVPWITLFHVCLLGSQIIELIQYNQQIHPGKQMFNSQAKASMCWIKCFRILPGYLIY